MGHSSSSEDTGCQAKAGSPRVIDGLRTKAAGTKLDCTMLQCHSMLSRQPRGSRGTFVFRPWLWESNRLVKFQARHSGISLPP